MEQRIIFHCDCNNFFASVELLDRPDLVGKCVAVAGNPENRTGIILAKNELAKKRNVQTAEPIWQAKQKCPDLVLLPPHHKKYAHFSKLINSIYERYTDRVEAFGIDESWLDVTGSYKLFAATPQKLADIIRQTITKETGLTISVGVSFNKVFAKLGSDLKKPDATTILMPEDIAKKVYPLPAEALLLVGKTTKQHLNFLKIFTIGDLANADTEILADRLGKLGVQISCYAKGNDHSPVRLATEKAEVKSVGNSLTFKRDLENLTDIKTAIGALSDSVAYRLRKHMLRCQSVQIVIKDTSLKTISRQQKLPFATDLAKDIAKQAYNLVLANWNMQSHIRLLSVTAQNLTNNDTPEQTSFFENTLKPDKKQQNLELAMDSIREKFGRTAIVSGSIIKDDLGLSRIDHDEE